MRTAIRSALLLGSLVLAAGPAAHAADARGVLGDFLKGVSVRFGVACESMVVLPIVLDAEPATTESRLSGPDGVSWSRVATSFSLVDLTAGPAPTPHERFLAEGTLLTGGDRERMLGRPVPLIDDEHALVGSTVCDGRTQPVPPAGLQVPGPVAPIEQRKMQALDGAERLFPILQQIQACLAGLPPGTETVAAVLESPKVQNGVRDRVAALEPLLKACGGRTVGHVAFFGFRPVEVVTFAQPAEYQSCGRPLLRALAASHFFWHEVNGPSAVAAADEDVRRLIAEGNALLQGIARMHGQESRPQLGERCRWKMFAGAAVSDVRASGGTERFSCRFVLDEAGRFAHLEAIESGPETLYPQPYRQPGGRPVGDPPDNKGGGGLGPEALQRLLERMLENRERQARGQGR